MPVLSRRRRLAGKPLSVPSGIVYLDKSSSWAERLANASCHDNLSREIVRQSLLLAAREELGLGTRDAWLDEPMPATRLHAAHRHAAQP